MAWQAKLQFHVIITSIYYKPPLIHPVLQSFPMNIQHMRYMDYLATVQRYIRDQEEATGQDHADLRLFVSATLQMATKMPHQFQPIGFKELNQQFNIGFFRQHFPYAQPHFTDILASTIFYRFKLKPITIELKNQLKGINANKALVRLVNATKEYEFSPIEQKALEIAMNRRKNFKGTTIIKQFFSQPERQIQRVPAVAEKTQSNMFSPFTAGELREEKGKVGKVACNVLDLANILKQPCHFLDSRKEKDSQNSVETNEESMLISSKKHGRGAFEAK